MGRIVRRIVVIDRGPAGDVTTRTLFKVKEKRKSSEWARPLEKAQRRSLRAGKVFISELLDRHERSAGKRRDGWIRDAGINQMKAVRKAYREL